ncbi:hypothetical protein CTAYLR_004227 [Chrysophaeum taylorii]|uniref:Uncharacterized protein n=1 Tax=Chrysophaeum taylorii TaxID=2483200 RepID=A0AAD7UDP7_9STRA|nr:hypothetical protein CTAYLR_004227 [Chrysophaeum taylorii]
MTWLVVLSTTLATRSAAYSMSPRGRLITRCRATMAPMEGVDVFKRALSGDGSVSAKAVDCTRTVAEVCGSQGCLPLAATALGRAMTSCLLIADGIQDEETFQVRFDGDGPLRGVFALANGRLETRGYVGNPRLALDAVDVRTGVGQGQLKVVRLKNLPGEETSRPFSSIVDIVSGEIAEDINHYVATSEQQEGALAAGVSLDDTNAVAAAGGWRLTLLPGASDEIATKVVDNVRRVLESGVSTTDMFLRGETCDDVLHRLLDGLEPTILPDVARPSFRCECDTSRVYRTLALLPRREVRHILATNDKIEAKCEFCARIYTLSPDQIEAHLRKVDSGEITIT